MRLMLLAIAPALALLWYLFSRERWHTRQAGRVAWLFLMGGACTAIALVLNHGLEKYSELWAGSPEALNRTLYWLWGVGTDEELAKMLVLLAFLYPRQDFKHPAQGMLGAITVALGFAAVENVVYLQRYGTFTLMVRSVLTVPAHALFTLPMGVFLAWAKTAPGVGAKVGYLALALLVSAFLHGLYDALLTLELPVWNLLAYGQIIVMALGAWWLVRRLAPPPLEETA